MPGLFAFVQENGDGEDGAARETRFKCVARTRASARSSSRADAQGRARTPELGTTASRSRSPTTKFVPDLKRGGFWEEK
jgi:hypothetical protein